MRPQGAPHTRRQTEVASLWRVTIAHHDESLDLWQLRQNRLHEFDELIIDEERGRAGVVDGVDDLLRRKPTLTVCNATPIIGMAKKASRNRLLSQSRTPTVSPGRTPTFEGARQPSDPVTQFFVGQALQVAVDDLLARGLGERRVRSCLISNG